MVLTILLAIFLSCIFIQCVHLIVMLVRLSRPEKPQEPSNDPVTIIVCAHDEEKNLKELIPRLMAQEYPVFELIIVDDRSNDGSHDLLLSESAVHKKLRYITVGHVPDHLNGKKYGLTLGIKAARYEKVLLTDADCRPAGKLWLQEMANGFGTQTEFVLGHSMYYKEKGFLNLFIRYETLWTAIHFLSAAIGGRPYMATGRNLAYTKSVFLSNKGFSGFGHIVGGDDDLLVNHYAKGKNTRVVISEEGMTYSFPKRTWSTYFIQKVRHLSVGKHYRPATRITLGVLSLSHIFGLLFTVILLSYPGGLYWAAGGYLLRTLLLHITLDKTGRKLKAEIPLVTISLLDWFYVIYYLITGLSATLTKRIRWK